MAENEDKIKKITEALLAGGKMLGVHCGKCKSPLFEFEGKVVCPLCGELEQDQQLKEKAKEDVLSRVDRVLHSKLESLVEKLEKEEDPTKTLQLIEAIRTTLQALERAKK